jgi:hypothetical protein
MSKYCTRFLQKNRNLFALVQRLKAKSVFRIEEKRKKKITGQTTSNESASLAACMHARVREHGSVPYGRSGQRGHMPDKAASTSVPLLYFSFLFLSDARDPQPSPTSSGRPACVLRAHPLNVQILKAV